MGARRSAATAAADSAEQKLDADLPDGRAYGIRLSLADVMGISAAEVQRIMAGRQYLHPRRLLATRQVSRPVVEAAGHGRGIDSLYWAQWQLIEAVGNSSGSGTTGDEAG
jgi:error-prone DNA polymerase